MSLAQTSIWGWILSRVCLRKDVQPGVSWSQWEVTLHAVSRAIYLPLDMSSSAPPHVEEEEFFQVT